MTTQKIVKEKKETQIWSVIMECNNFHDGLCFLIGYMSDDIEKIPQKRIEQIKNALRTAKKEGLI